MDILDKNTHGATIKFTRDELYMLALAVATVCDGAAVYPSEFVTIMGWDAATYSKLGDQVAAAGRGS